MAGTDNIIEIFLAYFPTPILPNIVIVPWNINGNATSVESKLRGGRHRHFALNMPM